MGDTRRENFLQSTPFWSWHVMLEVTKQVDNGTGGLCVGNTNESGVKIFTDVEPTPTEEVSTLVVVALGSRVGGKDGIGAEATPVVGTAVGNEVGCGVIPGMGATVGSGTKALEVGDADGGKLTMGTDVWLMTGEDADAGVGVR